MLNTGGSKEYLVRASYLEIYNEDIRDLLSKHPNTKLELKESTDKGVYVKDLMQFVVKSQAEINSVLQVRVLLRDHQQQQLRHDNSQYRENRWITCTAQVCLPSACNRSCGSTTGWEEEPLCWSDYDEPGLFTLPLHLHHHH
jgi:hypothetical protein